MNGTGNAARFEGRPVGVIVRMTTGFTSIMGRIAALVDDLDSMECTL